MGKLTLKCRMLQGHLRGSVGYKKARVAKGWERAKGLRREPGEGGKPRACRMLYIVIMTLNFSKMLVKRPRLSCGAWCNLICTTQARLEITVGRSMGSGVSMGAEGQGEKETKDMASLLLTICCVCVFPVVIVAYCRNLINIF